ncbi:hypothetical protein WA026_016244 [Henosepilachna vigintioctopunctata]|uniref:Uncharacterized protein n=1 Tax=Henosepilachna vigintioctopunctata TaxID=420089 RepID=A0AAW1TWW8_9CUCU
MRRRAHFESDFNRYTDIQYAALSGQVGYLRRILENGGHIDGFGVVGYTALQLACKKSNEEIIDTILDFKPDLNIRCIENTTTLNIFIENFPLNERLLKRFLEEGADPNIPNFRGRTALHVATSDLEGVHYDEYIRLLLQYKANMQLKDRSGHTPLHLAISKGHHSAVTILLQNGADIDNENLEGHTELDMAILKKTDYPQVLQQIVEHHIIQHVGKKLDIPEEVKVLCEKEEYTSFKDRCHSELEKMKNVTVGDSTATYYDIFVLPPNALAKKLSKSFAPNIVQSFYEFDTELFPIFGEYMFPNFQAGFERFKAIGVGHAFWRRIYPEIAELCIDNINFFLTNEDLENLQRVFHKCCEWKLKL